MQSSYKEKICIYCLYSLVSNKRPQPAYQFSEIFPTPTDLIWTPPFINLGKVLFQQLKNIKKQVVCKGYFD